MSSYYEDETGSEARRVGWHSALDQAMRFEAIRSLVREGDRVIDVGCGLGALAEYLAPLEIDYLGLECYEPFLSESPFEIVQHNYMTDPIPEGDVVVGVGCLIGNDGENNWDTLLEKMKRAASREWVLIAVHNPPTALFLEKEYVPFPKSMGEQFSRFERVVCSSTVPDAAACLKVLHGSEVWKNSSAESIAQAYYATGDNDAFDRALDDCEPEYAAVYRGVLGLLGKT